jgi:hypothetical protein
MKKLNINKWKNTSFKKLNKVIYAIENIKKVNIIPIEMYQSNIRKITNSDNLYWLPFLMDNITKEELKIIRNECEIYWIWNKCNTEFIWDLMEKDFDECIDKKLIKILTPEDINIIWNKCNYTLVSDTKIHNFKSSYSINETKEDEFVNYLPL